MHMSLHEKLRHHLSEKDATWTLEGETTVGSWQEDGRPRVVVAAQGPLTADLLVDAHLRAKRDGASLVVAHDGAASPLAQRTAARFGITLLDAAALPLPTAPPPALAPETLIVADDEAPALAELDDPLPWDTSIEMPEPEPAIVPPHEMMHVPWIHEEEHHEHVPAGRTRAHVVDHPTHAASWGLPWPRPAAPMDGLSRADPALWSNRERLAAMRGTLDAVGAPSFGAVKPEGSAWLKRLPDMR